MAFQFISLTDVTKKKTRRTGLKFGGGEWLLNI
jgi:hypothetical protein